LIDGKVRVVLFADVVRRRRDNKVHARVRKLVHVLAALAKYAICTICRKIAFWPGALFFALAVIEPAAVKP
jgi:hypothetical protein